MASNQAESTKKKARLDQEERIVRAETLINQAGLGDDVCVLNLEKIGKSSYMVDCVTSVQNSFPQTKFILIIGSDLVRQLHKWEHWRKIVEKVPLMIFLRPGYEDVKSAPVIQCLQKECSAGEIKDAEPGTWCINKNPVSYSSSSDIVVQSEGE